MMQTIKINEGQTLLDVAIQHTGDASRAFEIALANGLNFSDDLEIGTVVLVPEASVENKKNVADFVKTNTTPASKKDDTGLLLEGVDYWAIGDEFIIS